MTIKLNWGIPSFYYKTDDMQINTMSHQGIGVSIYWYLWLRKITKYLINNVHPILSKWNMIVFFIRSKEPKNVLHIALIYDIYWSKTGNSYQIYTMITINLISNLTWVVSYAVVRTWVPSPVPPGDWPARWRKCRLCQWPNHWRRTESCWKITIELTLSLHCHK